MLSQPKCFGSMLATGGLLFGVGCTPGADRPGLDRTSGTQEILLVPAQAPEIFEEYIAGARKNEVVCPVYSLDSNKTVSPTVGPRAASESALAPFSATNLQEASVDEADRVKFNGEYLFIADSLVNVYYDVFRGAARPIFTPIFTGATSRTIRQDPPTSATGSPALESTASASAAATVTTGGGDRTVDFPLPPIHEVRVMVVDPDDPGAFEAARISLPNANGGIHGLYHLASNDTSQAALLAVLGVRNVYPSAPTWNALTHTTLDIYDVDNPADPVPAANVELDGHMVASRRLGDRLILVTRFQEATPQPLRCPYERDTKRDGSGADEGEDDGVDDSAPFQLLPMLSVNGGDPEPLVDVDSCFVPASILASEIRTSIVTTVTSIDLREPNDRISMCLAGTSASVYVSPAALYLAQPDSPIQPEGVRNIPGERIFKIALDEAGPIYRGSAFIEGRFATRNPSFSMGENDGVLGVMTTVLGSDHRLTLLGESEEAIDPEAGMAETELEIIAELPNDANPDPIGKPGEQLHSVRFMGDRVYAVTFKKIDPLYIIDIWDPENPHIAGEVEVSGFSDYLHPIGESLLLGIGKDAVDMGTFAWYQGIKLELFDVSDPLTLSSIDSVIIGMRGSQSAALTNHHAVTHLSLPNGPHRVTIPIEIHESDAVGDSVIHPWTETGLALFEVEASSNPLQSTIEPVGTIVRDVAGDGSYYEAILRASTAGDRAVLAGDLVHYVHDEDVWSASWFAPEDAIGPQ